MEGLKGDTTTELRLSSLCGRSRVYAVEAEFYVEKPEVASAMPPWSCAAC